jgi:hypothetical protein
VSACEVFRSQLNSWSVNAQSLFMFIDSEGRLFDREDGSLGADVRGDVRGYRGECGMNRRGNDPTPVTIQKTRGKVEMGRRRCGSGAGKEAAEMGANRTSFGWVREHENVEVRHVFGESNECDCLGWTERAGARPAVAEVAKVLVRNSAMHEQRRAGRAGGAKSS